MLRWLKDWFAAAFPQRPPRPRVVDQWEVPFGTTNDAPLVIVDAVGVRRFRCLTAADAEHLKAILNSLAQDELEAEQFALSQQHGSYP